MSGDTRARPPRMTADEFIAWAMEQPEDRRYELVDGEVVGMASKRAARARVTGLAFRALGDAIARAGLPCEAFPDGVAIRGDADTIFEPDAFVRCGPPAPDETVTFDDPVIVIEVLSRSTQALDADGKLDGYFRLPSVQHYLILKAEERVVIHHARGDSPGAIATRILRGGGSLRLGPPGLALDVTALFPPATPPA